MTVERYWNKAPGQDYAVKRDARGVVESITADDLKFLGIPTWLNLFNAFRVSIITNNLGKVNT